MPDNIEVAEDGRAAFMVADGEPAWHGLGQLKEKPQSTEDALRLSHCGGWNVHKVPIWGENLEKRGMTARTVPFKKTYGTVRTNPFTGELEGLGTVGELWVPCQNEELAAFGDALVEVYEGEGVWHTMGSLEEGRRVFMSLKLEGFMVGGEDAHDLYLIIAAAHDGTGSVMILISPVRVVCKNTLDMAIRGAKQRWSIRHVGEIQDKLDTARESLGLSKKYVEAFEKEAEKMAKQSLTDKKIEEFLTELIPDPKSEGGWKDRAAGQRWAINELIHNGETTEFARGTKWSVYNAVAEYADWLRPGNPERRAREALGINVNQPLKTKALTLLRGM